MTCPGCGDPLDAPTCPRCLLNTLSPADLSRLDRFIFDGVIVEAVKLLRDALRIGLSQALVLFQARYRTLRHLQPGRFSKGHQEYWEGFYS